MPRLWLNPCTPSDNAHGTQSCRCTAPPQQGRIYREGGIQLTCLCAAFLAAAADLRLFHAYAPQRKQSHVLTALSALRAAVDWRRTNEARHGLYQVISHTLGKLDVTYTMPAVLDGQGCALERIDDFQHGVKPCKRSIVRFTRSSLLNRRCQSTAFVGTDCAPRSALLLPTSRPTILAGDTDYRTHDHEWLRHDAHPSSLLPASI